MTHLAGVALGRPSTTTRSRIVVIVAWVAYLALAVVCLAYLLADLRDVVGPRAFVAGLIFAMLPAPVLVTAFVLLDRLNPEPTRLMIVAIVWGVCIATLISLRVNGWVAGALGEADQSSTRNAVFVAPWVEESAKGLAIFVIAWAMRTRAVSVIGGVVYGGLIGVGFAFTENIVYYSQVFQQALTSSRDRSLALDAVQQLFLWRGVAAPFVHPMFTLMTGIGIGLALRQKNLGARVLLPVAGFLGAVLLHMSYNTLASYSSNRSLIAAYIGILLPLVLAVALVVFLLRRHERRVIAARLHDYVTLGWLDPGTPDEVATRAARKRARKAAGKPGTPAARHAAAWQRTLVELGVVRDRIVRGVATGAERERESELQDQVEAVQQFRRETEREGVLSAERAPFGLPT